MEYIPKINKCKEIHFITNCIQKPKQTCKRNIFTTGTVGWPGVTHVNKNNLTPLIDQALAMPGYTEEKPDMEVLVGFGHESVLGVADKIVAGVKDGSIRHFFLVGGLLPVDKTVSKISELYYDAHIMVFYQSPIWGRNTGEDNGSL